MTTSFVVQENGVLFQMVCQDSGKHILEIERG